MYGIRVIIENKNDTLVIYIYALNVFSKNLRGVYYLNLYLKLYIFFTRNIRESEVY